MRVSLGNMRFRSLGREFWALADQCLVSGCNFGTGIILARLLGVKTFGVYALWYAVLMYLNTIQASLVIQPMLSLAPRKPQAERGAYLSGLLAAQLVITLLLCGIVGFAAVGVLEVKPTWRVGGLLLPFVFSVLFFQLQDWIRRYFYVQGRSRDAFLNDIVSYAGQIVVLLALWTKHSLSIPTAYWAIAITSCAAFLCGLSAAKVRPAWCNLRSAVVSSWQFSCDMFAAAQIQWIGSQGMLFVAGAFLGTTAVGGIRIAQNLAGPIIVFYQALDNVLPVRAAERLRDFGQKGLIDFLRQATLVGTTATAAFAVLVSLFAGPILALMYGPSARQFAAVLVWQLVFLAVGYPWRMLYYFHRTIGNTRVIMIVMTFAAVVNIIATFALVQRFEATGVVMAITIGQVASLFLLYQQALKHRFGFDKPMEVSS